MNVALRLVMVCPCQRRTIGEVRFFSDDGVGVCVVNYGHETGSCLWIVGEDGVWRREAR